MPEAALDERALTSDEAAAAAEPAVEWIDWNVEWSTVDPDENGVVNDDAGTVWDVITAVVDGRPCVLSAHQDGSVCIWDLETGREAFASFKGHTADVCALATAELDGRRVIISGGKDKSVRIWDPASGEQLGEVSTGPGYRPEVYALATTTLDGRPHLVTGGEDGFARVWDLTTGQQICPPLDPRLNGRLGDVMAVAVAEVDGRPLVVTGSRKHSLYRGRWAKTLRVWDLRTGGQIGEPITGHAGGVYAVATTTFKGRPAVVYGDEQGKVHIRDLGTRKRLFPAGPCAKELVLAVTAAVLDGHTFVATAGADGRVRVLDLTAVDQIGTTSLFPERARSVRLLAADRMVVGFDDQVMLLTHPGQSRTASRPRP